MNSGRGLTGPGLLLPGMLAVLLVPLLRRHPLPALALGLAGSFTATVTADSVRTTTAAWWGGAGPAWQLGSLQAVLIALAVGYVAATRSRRASAVSALVAFAVQAAAASYYRTGSDAFLGTVVFLALTLTTAWTTGRSLRERREHAEQLRAQTAARAVTAERLRIARELHDMVAHSIGVIAIQAGVGRRVVTTRPKEARTALAAIEESSRDTLAGLRRMLTALRETGGPEHGPSGPGPTLDDLGGLVARTVAAGVRVEVDRRGEPRPLPAEVELAAYRIVQEGLANVVRHAGAPAARVVLAFRTEDLKVEITDEGHGPAVPGTGHGLAGMRERTALLHGDFVAGPRPDGGFRVMARLPLTAGVRR